MPVSTSCPGVIYLILSSLCVFFSTELIYSPLPMIFKIYDLGFTYNFFMYGWRDS